MHLTEVAPVTQIRPFKPVVAAVQTSIQPFQRLLQSQFMVRTCAFCASCAQLAQQMLIDVRFVFCR